MRVPMVLLLGLLLAGCASLSKPLPPAPTVDEIVQLSQKTPPEEIIRRMRDSRALYRLSGSQLADLKLRGVADPVLDYMQKTQLDAERHEAYLQAHDRYMFYGWPGYGPFWGPYPYPYPYPYRYRR
jgi:hypothetical protein